MPLPRGLLCLLLAAALAFASDGIPARGSAGDYPAHQTDGKVAIGAAYVPPAQVRKLFGVDLDKHGYVVFEVGLFPIDSQHPSVSAGDFKLMRGKRVGIVGAATAHDVAAGVWRQPSDQPWVESPVPGAATPAGKRIALEQQLAAKSLPPLQTNRTVAGYLYFPQPSKDQHADHELLYLGMEEEIALKLSPSAKP